VIGPDDERKLRNAVPLPPLLRRPGVGVSDDGAARRALGTGEPNFVYKTGQLCQLKQNHKTRPPLQKALSDFFSRPRFADSWRTSDIWPRA
jgi:hypothetical protein